MFCLCLSLENVLVSCVISFYVVCYNFNVFLEKPADPRVGTSELKGTNSSHRRAPSSLSLPLFGCGLAAFGTALFAHKYNIQKKKHPKQRRRAPRHGRWQFPSIFPWLSLLVLLGEGSNLIATPPLTPAGAYIPTIRYTLHGPQPLRALSIKLTPRCLACHLAW